MLIFFLVFYKFQGDSRVLHKIQGSRSQNKFQAFQGTMGTLSNICNFIYVYYWGHHHIVEPLYKLTILIPSSTVVIICNVYQVVIIFCEW